MTAIETLKQWFSNLKKPTQEQFWAWLDSFWHKSEKIPMASVEGLDKLVEGTASAEQLSNHLNDTQAHKVLFDKKVDKVEGKELSSNDFTNEYKEKLEGLHQVDISRLLPKGDYTGTAQDLKKQIDDKADKNHKHSWGDIEGKPNTFIDTQNFFEEKMQEGFKIEASKLNDFVNRSSGSYVVKYGNDDWGGLLLVFRRSGSSASSLEFLMSHYIYGTRLSVRHSIDGVRYAGFFKQLAWYDDVIRAGVRVGEDTTLNVNHQNQVVFVTNACRIELNQIQNMGSVSFRKVFDDGTVTFTCTGKNIIYTGDTTFNGKKGSTAVISIYENDCYIDIRNI